MSKLTKLFILLITLSLPTLIWLRMHRPVHPDTIIDKLHIQFEDISFISIDYHTSKRKLLGIDFEVFTGVLHVRKDQNTEKYQFIADAYTGEIMEITSQ